MTRQSAAFGNPGSTIRNPQSSTYQIDIANLQKVLEIDELFLCEVAQRTLSEERVVKAQISIALVDNDTIRRLNRQFLDRDSVTDVLSFPLECAKTELLTDITSDQLPRGAGKRLDGEVVISVEAAVQRSREFCWSPRDEAVLYLVHGLLHLCGYADLTIRDRQVMRSREQAILNLWDLAPHSTQCKWQKSRSGADS